MYNLWCMHLVYLAGIRIMSLERHGEKRQMYQGALTFYNVCIHLNCFNFNNVLAISGLWPWLYIATSHEMVENMMFAWPCYAINAEHFGWSTHHVTSIANVEWFLYTMILQLWHIITRNLITVTSSWSKLEEGACDEPPSRNCI